MASTSSRPDSPDVDFSVIKTSIDMGHSMIDQILYGIHYGSDEVRSLLRDECDFILECKICRNLFRSFPNFVAHKRVYCMECHADKNVLDQFEPNVNDEDTVIIQPEAPEDRNKQSQQEHNAPSVVENVINNNYKGKSKEYQFYTKVAEDVERRRVTKTTNTISLTPLSGSTNAVKVNQSKGDNTTASPKKASPVKHKEKLDKSESPAKNKNSIKSVCADLVKKKLMQGTDQGVNMSKVKPARLTTRSRKSSPRKSIDYMEEGDSCKDSDGEGMEVDVENVDDTATSANDVNKKDLMELCDLKTMKCKVCKKAFTRSNDLLFHVKIKHVKPVLQKSCPCCIDTFDNFSLLARHLKTSHHKNEAFINEVKVTLRRTHSGSANASIVKPGKGNVVKISDGLSYTAGGKKCDKCDKVFWKTKSYKRHYATCKGQGSSQPSETDKSKQKKGSMNNEAFLKLEEKLRAGVIHTIYPEDIKNKTKDLSKDKNVSTITNVIQDSVKSKMDKKTVSTRGKQADVNLAVKSLEVKQVTKGGAASSENPKTPIKMLISKVNDQPKITTMFDASQTKTYNLRLGNSSKEQVKLHTEHSKGVLAAKLPVEEPRTPEKDVSKVSKDVNNGSPGFKKLEQRLVREAGLGVEDPVVVTEIVGDISRANSEEKAAASTRKISTEQELDVVPISGLKEQKLQRGSPEIKQLMEKLARDVLEPKPATNDGTDESGITDAGETGSHSVEDKSEEGTRRRRSSRMSSQENKTEKIEKHIESEDVCPSSNKASVSRDSNVSRDGNTRKDKTPEKQIDPNLSPVSSPGRGTVLPASPTPSLQSTDSYNLKFKMTVQEMAELVESTSLTKFAKDRKKRAHTILNKKQIKEAQKINPSLSKPMKRHIQKRNIVIRNVYGTRNKGIKDSKPTTTGTRSSTMSEFKPTLKENQDRSKKLSREQKRLMNSAGFVEEKFYAVSSLMKERSDSDPESRRNAVDNRRLVASDQVGTSFPPDSDPSSDHDKPSRSDRKVSLETIGDTSCEVTDVYDTVVEKGDINELIDRGSSGDVDKGCKKTNMKLTSISDRNDISRYSLRGLDEGHIDKDKSHEIVEDKPELRPSKEKTREIVTDKHEHRPSKEKFCEIAADKHELRPSKEKLCEIAADKHMLRPIVRVKSCGIDIDKHTLGHVVKEKPIVIDEIRVDKVKSTDINVVKHAVSSSSNDKVTERGNSADVGENSRKDNVIQESSSVKIGNRNSNTKGKSYETEETPTDTRHRTRLSTGSIYFDSELLTMSPTKAEKIVSDRNKQLEMEKRVDKPVVSLASRLAGIGDKLQTGHQRTNSGPQRYSLQTGVQQCQKCQRKFWKNSTYRSHMIHSSCSDRRKSKFGRKRALSVTPEGKAGSNETPGDVSGTKCKRSKDVHGGDDVVSDRRKVSNRRKQLNSKSNESTTQNKDIVNAKVTLDNRKSISTRGKTTKEQIDTTRTNTSQQHDTIDEVDSLNTSVRSSIQDLDSNKTCVLSTEMKEGRTETHGVLPDEVAGPSGINLHSEVDSNSDDDSDFSGFSEDDLRSKELELSQIDIDETDDLDDYVDECAEDMLSDGGSDVGSDDEMMDDGKLSEAEEAKRPVRKSALNRFSHVEEIWVYKEPGKPVTEKCKLVKNREFVSDALNPAKFHCHNTKDVDRLIDEVNLKCKQCDTPCTSISNLRRHVIRHLGWKRYKCRLCSFTCYDMSNCRQHTLRVHEETLTSRNFDTFMTDLKREANCRRSAKRSKTIQKLKTQSPEEELFIKSKPVTPSQGKSGKLTKRKLNKQSELYELGETDKHAAGDSESSHVVNTDNTEVENL